MAQELEEFNAKASNKDSLYNELKKMDANAIKPVDNSAEMEKRRQILKGVKQTIEKGDAMSMSVKGGNILDDLEVFKID
jgi:hypothetical protein